MIPSKYQQAVLDAVAHDTYNLMVRAVAGSGKTATLKMICELVAATSHMISIIALAFNKEIANTLGAKLPPAVKSTTMHSHGLNIIRDNWTLKVGVDSHGAKQRKVMEDMFGKTRQQTSLMKEYIPALLDLISKVRGTHTDPGDWAEIEATAVEYDVDLQTLFAAKDPIHITEDVKIACEKLRANKDQIDFDDMLDLVVHYRLKGRHDYDLVLVDESQDLNRLQAEFVALMLEGRPVINTFDALDALLGNVTPKADVAKLNRPTKNRVVLVGDERQAIYKFRGADAQSMENLAEKFQVTRLPLSISYRCPVAVVNLAQTIIGPNIEPSETAKQGTVTFNKEGDLPALLASLQNGDMVMSRTNAPLMGAALKCLRTGKRVTIRGRADFGTGLTKLVHAVQDRASNGSMPAFLTALSEYIGKQIEKAIDDNKTNQATLWGDKHSCLCELAQDMDSPDELAGFLTRVFKDDSNDGVIFSSIHRAKGLEANHAIILQPEKLPHPMAYRSNNVESALSQERNLAYVAVTRAMDRLTLQPLPDARNSPFPLLQDMFDDAAKRREKRGFKSKSPYGDFISSDVALRAIDF
ncbi:MAG: ATP-dependent helicase [Phycisphaerae bacterium]|jgi:DNA helicase-2/ATP-dependent DNA helicase PcrA